ncbi:NADH dehydrogenase [ubiquinone] 1 alpha subcomplex subunit 7 [Halyomorpha halys]|uniref:NADH dehydrogenase [ubiquinone] 1 alpha subcomplex subunit 7 n=1 Tax=Halyomorpha halys TaxID=286706 RepID=UPI0006D4FCC2|nr:NADH dehydrogenase [ubiquinone] 1 alpha subcomplex subunit 7-like [Halyomorpha halys]
MGKATPRSATPALKVFRDFLLGRIHKTPLRFGDYYAPRTQPPPDLPLGPHSKLADNYYYSHDGRRETSPPVVIANQSTQKRIETKSDQAAAKSFSSVTPGNVYHWD